MRSDRLVGSRQIARCTLYRQTIEQALKSATNMARRKKRDPELEVRLNRLKSIVQPSNLASYREAAEVLSDPEEFELMKVFFNEHSGVPREVWFCMVPFFQEHPDLWARLREEVPFHVHSCVDQWLPRQMLSFSGTKEEFCAFATEIGGLPLRGRCHQLSRSPWLQ